MVEDIGGKAHLGGLAIAGNVEPGGPGGIDGNETVGRNAATAINRPSAYGLVNLR